MPRVITVALLFGLAATSVGCAKAPIGPPVLFALNAAEVNVGNDKADRAVRTAARTLKEDDEWSLLIVGLADRSGDAKHNLELSKRRATFVREMLIAEVPGAADRIRVHGVGQRKSTKFKARGERRVEFVFYKDKGQRIPDIIRKSKLIPD